MYTWCLFSAKQANPRIHFLFPVTRDHFLLSNSGQGCGCVQPKPSKRKRGFVRASARSRTFMFLCGAEKMAMARQKYQICFAVPVVPELRRSFAAPYPARPSRCLSRVLIALIAPNQPNGEVN